MPAISDKFHQWFTRITDRAVYRRPYKKITTFIKKYPFTGFFIALGLLFLAILIGNILNTPKAQKASTPIAKIIHTYNIGQAPQAMFQGKVEKSGVIKIVALASGIVQNISVNEGDSVYKGQQLVSLSTNYQGGNAPALQAQITQQQYNNVASTFDQQKDAIQKQKDIANINLNNFSDQQAIATASASETSSLISANQGVLDQLNQQLTTAQNSGTPATTLIQQQSTINQLQGAQDQLQQSLRALQEQTNTGRPPGQLANTQHDLAIEQLDIQEKSLELNKEVSKLQADVAEVNAATMFPASPFSGVVDRVYIRVGQLVSPGTQIAEITATDPKTTIVVDVPQFIARNISAYGTNTLSIDNKTYAIRPTFIPTEATNGTLYSIIYTISDTLDLPVTDGQYVNVAVPVGSVNTSSVVPFVPIDAIYQTQDANYLLVIKNHKAVTRNVTLGNVVGSYAEITQGLSAGDQVIIDRNVIAGDSVTTQ